MIQSRGRPDRRVLYGWRRIVWPHGASFFYLIAKIIEQDDDLLLIPNDLLLIDKVFQNSITDGRKEEKEKREKQNTNTKGQTENDADHTEKNGNNAEYTEKRRPLFHTKHLT